MDISNSKLHTIRLVGGTRDGETREIASWLDTLHVKRLLTREEHAALDIDGVTCWEGPDDVYVRQPDGTFLFSYIVHYAPDDAVNNPDTMKEGK